MKYRPDIDGLRAVTVLPVLFYHAGIPGFPGGFIGVDIFFVIRDICDPAIAGTMRTAGIRERDRAMARLVAAKGATFVSIYDVVCRGGGCDEFVGGDVPMQFDAGHLTAQGSIEVGRRLKASFVKLLARADHAPN